MKVIILQAIPGRGQPGQIKEVAEGYARHCLFPQKLAKPATADALLSIDRRQEKRVKLANRKEREDRQLAAKISGVSLSLKAKASPAGTLFAAIEDREIATELNRLFGGNIQPGQVKTTKPIKSIGEHRVEIIFAPGGSALITALVSAL